MIHFLWAYLYVAGFSSILIYTLCLAAARADRIKERLPMELSQPVPEPSQVNRSLIAGHRQKIVEIGG
ncbi:MAG: hypothetical protein R2932_08585 [Caldilineaceae bacterium]